MPCMVGYGENCCRRLAGQITGDQRIKECWVCFLFPMPCTAEQRWERVFSLLLQGSSVKACSLAVPFTQKDLPLVIKCRLNFFKK